MIYLAFFFFFSPNEIKTRLGVVMMHRGWVVNQAKEFSETLSPRKTDAGLLIKRVKYYGPWGCLNCRLFITPEEEFFARYYSTSIGNRDQNINAPRTCALHFAKLKKRLLTTLATKIHSQARVKLRERRVHEVIAFFQRFSPNNDLELFD